VAEILSEAVRSALATLEEIQSVYDYVVAYGSVPNHNHHPVVFSVLMILLRDYLSDEPKPLDAAVVAPARGLRVHNSPGLFTPVTHALSRGTRVDVWELEKKDGLTWARIGNKEWVSNTYLNKL